MRYARCRVQEHMCVLVIGMSPTACRNVVKDFRTEKTACFGIVAFSLREK